MKKIQLIILGSICCLLSLNLEAQESKFKALFLYKFSEYIKWPSDSEKLVIGVLGKTDVYNQLSEFAQRRQTFDVLPLSGPEDMPKCNIVFMPNSSGANYNDYKNASADKSILLVCDDENYAERGCDICFYFDQGKLGFMINKQNIESKKMIASSKLLSLGKPI